MKDFVVHFNLDIVQFVVAAILPAITALITKRFAHAAWKGTVLFVLSVIAAVLGEVIKNGGTFSVVQTVLFVINTFGVAVVAHFGLLKPLGVSGTHGVLAKKTPTVGLGKEHYAWEDRHGADTPPVR